MVRESIDNLLANAFKHGKLYVVQLLKSLSILEPLYKELLLSKIEGIIEVITDPEFYLDGVGIIMQLIKDSPEFALKFLQSAKYFKCFSILSRKLENIEQSISLIQNIFDKLNKLSTSKDANAFE